MQEVQDAVPRSFEPPSPPAYHVRVELDDQDQERVFESHMPLMLDQSTHETNDDVPGPPNSRLVDLLLAQLLDLVHVHVPKLSRKSRLRERGTSRSLSRIQTGRERERVRERAE